jgi:hypothetical protein
MINGDYTEKIRRRAYAIWEGEGRPHGRDRIHWLRAEAEVRDIQAAPATATPPGASEPKDKGRRGPRNASGGKSQPAR